MNIPFERLVAETTEGITVCDARAADMPLIWVNRGFLELTGYTEAEVLGRNCRFLQGPKTDSAAVAGIREALAAQSAVVIELQNYRRDGSSFFNILSLSPVLDESGSAEYFIGVQTDVTDRRLRFQREREFIDNVAHELKTPLTALSGLLETLDKPLPEATRSDLLARMGNQTQRLIAMVEELLSLSALEAALRAPVVQLDLRELVLEVLEVLEQLAESREIALHTQIPAEPLLFRGSPPALAALVRNLLDNAVKYTPPGGEVRLSLTHRGDVIELVVSDTGPGIAPEHHARVFERFYRVAPDRARTSGGAGIGLALVAESVRQARGTITLASALGQGCTFTVRLPAK